MQHALVVPQNFADESPNAVVQPEPNCLILTSVAGVPMDQAISDSQAMADLAALDLMAPCLSMLAPSHNKADVRAALHQGTFNHAGPDFVWVALPGVRMERWIANNQA